MKRIRIGTRSSALALWQANRTAEELQRIGAAVEIVPIKTTGDAKQSGPIARIGAQGVFTVEIQNVLLEGRIDLAVHSLKDLPTEPVAGLRFSATLPRADVEDCLVSRRFRSLDEITEGSRIGTGSLRRKCQLLYLLRGRGVRVEDIRGNVETRLRKLDEGEYDAIVLAAAGLLRLGFADRITEKGRLPRDRFYPAVGQGALGLESRLDDRQTNSLLEKINDPKTYLAVIAERKMLLTLKGGCIAPIGARTDWSGNRLTLWGRVIALDGSAQFDADHSITFDEPVVSDGTIRKGMDLGVRVAERLLQEGADAVLQEVNRQRETSSREEG